MATLYDVLEKVIIADKEVMEKFIDCYLQAAYKGIFREIYYHLEWGIISQPHDKDFFAIKVENIRFDIKYTDDK